MQECMTCWINGRINLLSLHCSAYPVTVFERFVSSVEPVFVALKRRKSDLLCRKVLSKSCIYFSY